MSDSAADAQEDIGAGSELAVVDSSSGADTESGSNDGPYDTWTWD